MQTADRVAERLFDLALPVAIDRRDDRALRNKKARDLDRRVYQAAAVVAQVENVAFGVVRLAVEQRLAHFVGRGLSQSPTGECNRMPSSIFARTDGT